MRFRLCLAVVTCALACGIAAAKDLGTKPPVAPQGAANLADKSPRCLPEAVTRCRAGCDTKKWDQTPKDQQPRKIEECKQDCVRGC